MAFDEIWAKSPRKGELTGESLEVHVANVLRNLAQLRRRAPALSVRCSMSRLWLRVSLSAALHDLGKCCAGFQDCLRGHGAFPYRHEVLSAVFVPWVLGDDEEEDGPWVSAAVLTHHKDIDMLGEYMGPRPDRRLLHQLTPEFFRTAESIFRHAILRAASEAGFPFPSNWTANAQVDWQPEDCWQALQDSLEPVRRLKERLRDLPAEAAESLAGRFLRGLLILSDHSGSAGERIRFTEVLERPERLDSALPGLPAPEYLYRHQREARETASDAILIAPTGSGKTEAALFWAARQKLAAGSSPVLFYLLPYQASMNAMRRRLVGVFGESNVALQHSRSLHALYGMALDKDYVPAKAAAVARRERNLARLHTPPVRILSPYQIIRAAYQLKGHEAIWTDVSESSCIVDEIHAYESGRLGMILATLRHMSRDLGVRMLVMSATMPSILRETLQETLHAPRIIQADAATFDRFCRHEVQILDGNLLAPATIEAIRSDFEAGQSVLVVANTVGRAQQLWVGLKDLGASLLHGRFHSEDRNQKEKELLERQAVGKRSSSPALLVATQVVEVSLNVDFDVLYSDPAPLEALLQRFGRINRKSQQAKPQPKPVRVMNGIPEGCPVYEEGLVKAAIEQLRKYDGRLLREDEVTNLLDAIYSGPRATRWKAETKHAIETFQRDVLSICRPFRSEDWLKQEFEELFDGFEVLPTPLEAEYQKRIELEPLSAAGMFVPITQRQYHKLRKEGRIRRDNDILIADCAYNSEQGLQITSAPQEDGV